jgi:glycosyltransferase involved in cell wall biosynthesis
MRIAIYHELPKGGARRVINEYSFHLKKRNKVDLYLIDSLKVSGETSFYSKIFFYRFTPKVWKGKNWKVRLYKDSIELIKLYYLNKKIARDIDAKKYDIVFVSASQFIEAPFIMRFLKTPFLYYITDPNYRLVYDDLLQITREVGLRRYWYEKLNRFVRKILDKQNVRKSYVCLSCSKYMSTIFEKTYRQKNTPIYLGVDINFFTPGKLSKDIDIFYIGSYDPIDGYDLLQAAAKLMKVKTNIRALLFEEEWISDDKVLRSLYQRSKIMVCPARKEGFGAAVLEAMACGIPVVAVNEAGHKETVIHEKTGYLVPRDPEVLAKKLDWLLTHPEKLKEIGETARNTAVDYWSWELRTKNLEKYFYTFLKKNNFNNYHV